MCDTLAEFDTSLAEAMRVLPPRAGRPPFVPSRAPSVADIHAKRLDAALTTLDALRRHLKALKPLIPSKWAHRAALEADLGVAEMMLEQKQYEDRLFTRPLTTAELEARA